MVLLVADGVQGAQGQGTLGDEVDALDSQFGGVFLEECAGCLDRMV